MYKILLTSHSDLCKGLLGAAKMILGDADGVEYVVLDERGIEIFSKELDEKIGLLANGNDELLILADIFGGTPFNQSMIKSQQYENVRVIAGASLPMVIEAIMNQNNKIDEVIDTIVSSTKESIVPGIILNKEALEINE